MCQGNYAVGPEYDGQIGHRYFDTGRYPADLICKINCDVLLIEHDQAPEYEGIIALLNFTKKLVHFSPRKEDELCQK